MTLARWGGATAAAALVLSVTACGASAEDNAREYTEHLMAGDLEAAQALMTPEMQWLEEGLSTLDLLGATDMIDCEIGDSKTTEKDGESLVVIDLQCDESKYYYEVTVSGDDNLVDDTNYETAGAAN